MREDKSACKRHGQSVLGKVVGMDMEDNTIWLTGAQQKLIDRAVEAIISSYGSYDVIEDEAIKVASQAGPLPLGAARDFALERLLRACLTQNKPRKVMKALITKAFEIGDSMIKKPEEDMFTGDSVSRGQEAVCLKEDSISLPQKTTMAGYDAAARETVSRLLEASVAANTRRAYSSRLRAFFSWCSSATHSPTAPKTIALYIAAMVDGGKSVSTIQQTLSAISVCLRTAGQEDVTKSELVRRTVKGVRRTIGVAPVKKQPLRIPVLEAIICGIDRGTAAGSRDAALILLGFAGAFRRSELVSLDVTDLSPTAAADGRPAYEINLRRSKTDPEGRGQIKGIFSAGNARLCPVAALRDYMASCGISAGPLLRRIRKGDIVTAERLSDKAVARIIQKRAAAAGVTLDLSGHSLRSGFITSAAEAGRTERSIMNQTGHRSVTTLRGYIDRVNALQDNAAAGLL